MFRYRVNVYDLLKNAGYSTYRLRKEKLLPESTIQKLSIGNTSLTLESLNVICNILHCQPGELIEWVPEQIDMFE